MADELNSPHEERLLAVAEAEHLRGSPVAARDPGRRSSIKQGLGALDLARGMASWE